MTTGAQIRAARELLGWPAGVEFTNGDEPGVKLKVAVPRAARRP